MREPERWALPARSSGGQDNSLGAGPTSAKLRQGLWSGECTHVTVPGVYRDTVLTYALVRLYTICLATFSGMCSESTMARVLMTVIVLGRVHWNESVSRRERHPRPACGLAQRGTARQRGPARPSAAQRDPAPAHTERVAILQQAQLVQLQLGSLSRLAGKLMCGAGAAAGVGSANVGATRGWARIGALAPVEAGAPAPGSELCKKICVVATVRLCWMPGDCRCAGTPASGLPMRGAKRVKGDCWARARRRRRCRRRAPSARPR